MHDEYVLWIDESNGLSLATLEGLEEEHILFLKAMAWKQFSVFIYI